MSGTWFSQDRIFIRGTDEHGCRHFHNPLKSDVLNVSLCSVPDYPTII